MTLKIPFTVFETGTFNSTTHTYENVSTTVQLKEAGLENPPNLIRRYTAIVPVEVSREDLECIINFDEVQQYILNQKEN